MSTLYYGIDTSPRSLEIKHVAQFENPISKWRPPGLYKTEGCPGGPAYAKLFKMGGLGSSCSLFPKRCTDDLAGKARTYVSYRPTLPFRLFVAHLTCSRGSGVYVTYVQSDTTIAIHDGVGGMSQDAMSTQHYEQAKPPSSPTPQSWTAKPAMPVLGRA